MPLRDYQTRAIEQLYRWFETNEGNPCLVMPTGSGKSWVIAELCRDALQSWPETRILILSHVKEILIQDIEKIYLTWPMAPLGIYSAGLRKREIEPITVASIQSVRNKGSELGFIDIVIVDEAHLISHKDQGGYRTLINKLKEINPGLRVIGLTATPYRLGHGMITDKPALFDAVIEPVGIEELIAKGHLLPLRSKTTERKIDVKGVGKRGGEYIEHDLQWAVDTEDNNSQAVDEVIRRGVDRRSWLFFCTGVAHAHHICELLLARGITAACVTGETLMAERESILSRFRTGDIRAVTNANVLTTGFDHPGLDLIAMLRPTMSPGLYVQMAGRGMRPAEGKTDCLVLDFAGVIATHGPIVNVQPPRRGEDHKGEAPSKECPQCGEILHLSLMTCSACGYEFPTPKPELVLRNDDIMGYSPSSMEVKDWKWRKHVSRTSGKEMIAVTYYGGLSDPPITEYFPITHEGYAGDKAVNTVAVIAGRSGVTNVLMLSSISEIVEALCHGRPPKEIGYRMDGKYHRVINRKWA